MAHQNDFLSSVDANKDKPIAPKRIPKINETLTEELVVVFVGPVGSGCSKSAEVLKRIFDEEYGYRVIYHRLSKYIEENCKESDIPVDKAQRIDYLQKKGDELRSKYGNKHLAAKVIETISERREIEGFDEATDGTKIPKNLREVHIVDSVKHPDELKLLKSTYGEILWCIGVFAPFDVRKSRLEIQLNLPEQTIDQIVKTDYREEESYGQKVRDVFFHADFFVRNDKDNDLELKATLSRFLEVLFGSPVHTPNIDESSMYSAYAEAAKSACLSRAVGAAIVNMDGELIGQGRNDVPKFKGGLYGEDDREGDNRCHAWRQKVCHNDRKKNILYKQIYERLIDGDVLKSGVSSEQVERLLRGTDVQSLIEYSRAVHAEMDAITSVARTNKSGILGSTLYSTTFPCHSCARHIVASGVTKVFFIEPYPKSLAVELHSDAVSENEADNDIKVVFLQYTGIAPKNILKLFNSNKRRKDETGKVIDFNKRLALPIVSVSLADYTMHEKLVVAELGQDEDGNE